MKKNMLLLLALLATALSYAQVIRVATYQYADNDRIKNIQPFARYLTTKYHYETSVKSYPTVQALIEAVQNNEADIAFINSFGYLLLEASGKPYPMHPVAVLEVRADAKDNYKTAVLVAAGVQLKNISGLKTKAGSLRLALVNKGSTSGNLVPRLAFAANGIKDPEKSFASFEYTKTHAAAIEALLNGKADIAAMGNNEYDKYLAMDSANKQKLKLLWLSPEIPLGPVLFNNRFGSAVGGELQNALLELHLHDTAALDAIKAGWSEAKQTTHFKSINTSHYDALRKINKNKKELSRILEEFTQ